MWLILTRSRVIHLQLGYFIIIITLRFKTVETNAAELMLIICKVKSFKNKRKWVSLEIKV